MKVSVNVIAELVGERFQACNLMIDFILDILDTLTDLLILAWTPYSLDSCLYTLFP